MILSRTEYIDNDESDEVIRKIRLVSREFYDSHAHVLPYRPPEDWDILETGTFVPSLLERTEEFVDVDHLVHTVHNIIRLNLPDLYPRLFEKNPLIRGGCKYYVSEVIYPLIAQSHAYDIAYVEVDRSKKDASLLRDLGYEFIRHTTESRSLELIKKILRHSAEFSVEELLRTTDFIRWALPTDKMDLFPDVFNKNDPVSRNAIAFDFYVNYNMPDLGIKIAESSPSEYGGILYNFPGILYQYFDRFIKFRSETGIWFRYDVPRKVMISILKNWRDLSSAKKRLVCEVIENRYRPNLFRNIFRDIHKDICKDIASNLTCETQKHLGL